MITRIDVKDLAKMAVSGALAAAVGAVLAVYLIDFMNYLVVGHAMVREIWSGNGFTPWTVQMAQFGAPLGLIASACCWTYQKRATKELSTFVNAVVWFLLGFAYFYWIFRTFSIDGDYYYLALTSYGMIAGLLFRSIHKGLWSSLQWIVRTPIKIGSN